MNYVKSCLIITMLLGVQIGYSQPDCPSEPGSGDVNFDGEADVLDIVAIVNMIVGGSGPDECAAAAADVNGDGDINVIDIVIIINGILG